MNTEQNNQEQLPALELWRKPAELMRWSTDIAGVCREIVTKTAVSISGRKYVKCEGWQAIAVAHGCVASSRDVEKVQGGYRAIGEVRRMSDGVLLAQAEGFIGEDEPTWFGGESRGKVLPKRADYAIRAMCQTRAISRACRSAFAHVVVMIDGSLSTTPAEEVPDGGFIDVEASRPNQTTTNTPAPRKDAPKAHTSAAMAGVEQSATEKTRDWFVGKIPEGAIQAVLGYLIDKGWIMPNETLADLPLHHVPTSTAAYTKFMNDVGEWELGESGLAPKADVGNPSAAYDKEPWYGIICPIPRKGMKRDEYMKSPDTIGSLYDASETNEDARTRLFGFANKWKPEARTVDGKTYQPSDADYKFRASLDQFKEWHHRHREQFKQDVENGIEAGFPD